MSENNWPEQQSESDESSSSSSSSRLYANIAVKFLMARKFNLKRALALYNEHQVRYLHCIT